MAINIETLSITSVFNSIVSFFKSQENSSSWRDLTTNSEGSFLIRMLANIFSAISYRVVAQSRENYLSTASLTSSNVGISVNLGYSAFRGTNIKRKIKLTPSSTYTYPKLSVIGTYNASYDIITLSDVSLEEGVPVEFEVAIGNVKEETITTGTSNVKPFTLFTTGISEDYVLYLDGSEVPSTSIIKEMVDDKYLVRTNPYKSVDIMYLNSLPRAQYKYGAESDITIRYIELANVTVAPFTTSMFTVGVLNDYSTLSAYLPFESVDSIKVNAPLNHELQNLIRSKADYANRLRQVVPTVSDVTFKALTPTYTLISYLKNDLTMLSSTETEKFNTILEGENFFGTPLPDITVPRREVANLNIDMALSNKYKNISDIHLDIANLLANYYNYALGISFNTYDFERKLEALSYVRYARVNHVVNERKAGANYQLGYILETSDNYYIASQVLGLSGYTEPSWNVPLKQQLAIDTGLETADGSVIWKAYKKLPSMDDSLLSKWQPSFQYGIGEYVYTDKIPNYMFKCVDLAKSSGSNAPDITNASIGNFFIDGSVVWVTKVRTDARDWTSFTTYRLGDSVNVPSNSNLSLECVSYLGTTGTTQNLEFELPEYKVLSETSNTFTIEHDKTFYLRANDLISAAYQGGYKTFTVASSVYYSSSDTTVITVKEVIDTTTIYTKILTNERGTRDGQILWKLVDDITDISYPWNNYVTFDYNLNIVGQ